MKEGVNLGMPGDTVNEEDASEDEELVDDDEDEREIDGFLWAF